MQSGMAIVRANAQHRQIAAAKERIINTFAETPSTKCKATIKVARAIILNGPYVFQGKLYDIKAKSLGVGVYELSVKEPKNE